MRSAVPLLILVLMFSLTLTASGRLHLYLEGPSAPLSYEEVSASHFGGGGLGGLDFEAMEELGVHWLRVPLDIVYDPSNPYGEGGLSPLDELILECQEHGVAVFMVVSAVRNEEGEWPPPEFFAEQLKKVVERYDGDGVDDLPGLIYPVRYWEIFNEYEEGMGPWVDLSKEEYLEYYRLAYQAIKEACPECQVAPGSIVGPHSTTLEYLVEAGASDLIDFISYHCYEEYLRVDELRVFLERLGLADRPIWLTESQFGGMMQAYGSEEDVARWLVQSYVYALAHGFRVVMPSELRAQPQFPEGLKWSCLIDEDGVKRPSFYAYKTLIAKLEGFTEVEVLSVGEVEVPMPGQSCTQGLFAFKFLVKGKPVYVVWGEGELPSEIRGLLRVTNLYGEERVVDASELKVSEDPVFIEPLSEQSSSLTLSVEPQSVILGGEVVVEGYLTPPLKGEVVELTFIPLRGPPSTVRVTTGDGGYFNYTFTSESATVWAVTARWPGSERYGEAKAEAFFTVFKEPATLPSKLEIHYRRSLAATLTLERWVKNWVRVKNVWGKPLSLSFDVAVKCEEGWVGVSPFPQPFNLYLDPGENQTIWYFIDLTYRSCGAGKMDRGEKAFKALVFIEDAERPGDYVALFIDYVVRVQPVEELEPNCVVQGYVRDPEGRPIAHARVELWGAYGSPQLFTEADDKGFFTFRAYATTYSDTGEPHGYNLRVEADGYQGISRALFPKPGEVINLEVTLKPLEERANYKLAVKVETSGYPIWEAAMSEDEEFIVFANGHHTYENPDPSKHGIYFLSTNGTILWRYLTTDQVWGVDVSSDGRYVAAAFLREGVVRLFDREGRVLWVYPCGETREVRINHRGDRVAIGTTFGDLILVDLETGGEVWRTFLEGQVRWTCFTKDDSVIYAGSGDGYLYKVDAATGSILGRAYVEAWPYRYGLALSDDEQYIATASKIGRVYLVRTSDMKPLWSFDTRGGCHWVDIAPNNAYVLVGSGGSYGRALFYLNGTLAWFGPVSSSGMALDENHVAVAEASIDIMTVDGGLLWSSGPLDAGVVFLRFSEDKSKIYAVTDKATFYVFKGGFEKVEEKVKPRVEKLKADVNGDGKVDLRDVETLRGCYGSRRGEPRFKPTADLNGDGQVDIIDLAILASQLLPWVSDITPAQGPGAPPPDIPEGADGPWNHRILMAVSSDGLTWSKTYKVLADQASVPDVLVDKEGYVRVYYVDYGNEGLSVAISRDLSTWAFLKVKGLPPEWVDPSVVILPDGRFRLYASYMPLQGPQDRIVSAISKDGIHFEVEEGVRYQEEGSTLTDPEVIYVDGRWIMYVCKLTEPKPRLVRLVSSDGLSFTKEAEFELEGTVPCLTPYDGGYRLYVHAEDATAILSYYSTDCRSWSGPVRVLKPGPPRSLDEYGVADPAVARLPDGTYVMFYKTWIQRPVKLGSKP